ncbi:hypothetical protein PLICRDRAFT_175069 [Plicaturopsis crispa FD-325 SS-3]|nr:hypothetical protein PLICRDRAFT_175069 [Plicaturopsis crispa FD-325 SS-3]
MPTHDNAGGNDAAEKGVGGGEKGSRSWRVRHARVEPAHINASAPPRSRALALPHDPTRPHPHPHPPSPSRQRAGIQQLATTPHPYPRLALIRPRPLLRIYTLGIPRAPALTTANERQARDLLPLKIPAAPPWTASRFPDAGHRQPSPSRSMHASPVIARCCRSTRNPHFNTRAALLLKERARLHADHRRRRRANEEPPQLASASHSALCWRQRDTAASTGVDAPPPFPTHRLAPRRVHSRPACLHRCKHRSSARRTSSVHATLTLGR